MMILLGALISAASGPTLGAADQTGARQEQPLNAKNQLRELIRQNHPHAAILFWSMGISEYGAGANIMHHEEPTSRPEPNGPWHPEEWQTFYHEVHWQTLAERPWIWCKLIWNMFDFGSDWRNEGGAPGINEIEARVLHDGLNLEDRCEWTYTPASP